MVGGSSRIWLLVLTYIESRDEAKDMSGMYDGGREEKWVGL
jgi:hypothetical protein